ncbi:MAG: hypothetical protein FJZ76_09430 [Bacteroidetes bacterium]|nr:hypothetical protein [Bacteroidota bacterium]
MKKVFAIFAIAGLMATAASCGKSAEEIEKAKQDSIAAADSVADAAAAQAAADSAAAAAQAAADSAAAAAAAAPAK